MQDDAAPNVNNVSGLLKAFVILGGVVLIIGMLLLAVMVIIRATTGDTRDSEAIPSEPVELALPIGVQILQVVVDGKRLVLLGEGADGQQYIAVVDADSGKRKSLIRVAPTE